MRNANLSALIPRTRVPLSEKIAWDSFEVAEATGLSERYVRELAAAGVFKATKVGKRTLFDPRQIRNALFARDITSPAVPSDTAQSKE